MSQTHFYHTNLPPHLRVLKDEIEGYAREYGLDFYETIFEVVDAENLNEIAAYGGFPTRYPHWSFGMQFEELKKGYEYGLSKIYEMVINNDPCYAYLMRCNHTVDQKLVMAHVYGHCLAPETRVETRGGSKLITDVKVGDEVLTHEGRYRRVRLVARREYKGDICRLKVMGGDEVIRITPEHPVLALRPVKASSQLVTAAHAGVEQWQSSSLGMGWDAERVLESAWVPAGELVAGDTIEIPVDHKNWLPPGEGDERVTDEVRSVVRERYEGYVYNFSVEEDESYVLSVGMTVHNCDFFKHNAFFGHTTRKMMDEIANHASRIRGYVERFGEDEVEAFLDRCMSVDDLIDIHSVAIKRRDEHSKYDFSKPGDAEPEAEPPMRFRAKPYMEGYINPPETAAEEAKRLRDLQAVPSFPDHPEKDVLLFLIEHAPLKTWQRDILSIVRDEAYYFFPQGQTKILNEGWASFWHSTIMTQKALHPSELMDYADHHSGTMATSSRRLNPYKLGIELLRDVERRWDMGQFGPEWDECDDYEARRKWDRQTGLGRAKIFEVRKVHNDITFIDTFLTPEFCKENRLFSFAYADPTKNYVVESREFQQVKQRLLASLTNFGKPWIEVVNGNHRNRGELLLRHRYNGVELKLNEAQDTLVNLRSLWGRPVHLETVIDDKPTVLSFDGTDHAKQVIGAENDPRRAAPPKAK